MEYIFNGSLSYFLGGGHKEKSDLHTLDLENENIFYHRSIENKFSLIFNEKTLIFRDLASIYNEAKENKELVFVKFDLTSSPSDLNSRYYYIKNINNDTLTIDFDYKEI